MRNFWEIGSTVGDFPFVKIHSRGERPTRSAVCTSSLFARCGLAWDKARPWAKRLSWQTQGGRVK